MAIETKYIGPTNTRGARIRVRHNDHVKFIHYPYHLEGMTAHAYAAASFARSLGWDEWATQLIGGGTKEGYVFIPVAANNRLMYTYELNSLE